TTTVEDLPREAGDPRGMRVVFGRGSLPDSEAARDELRAAGVVVRELSHVEEFWRGVDREVRAADGAAVGIPLPGVGAGLKWLEAVAPGLEGDRIAAIVGAGLHAGDPPAPLVVHSHHSLRERYPTSAGRPSQFIVVHGDLYVRLGGFDVALARFGDHAVVLDFLERALREHYAIGHRETPGLSPAGAYRPARSLLEWRRFAAAGALLALAAR